MLLQDENDNAPIFEQDKYTFKIKENNEPGAILATLRATDADVGENGEVRYTIAGEDAEAFSVDEITGAALSSFQSPALLTHFLDLILITRHMSNIAVILHYYAIHIYLTDFSCF